MVKPGSTIRNIRYRYAFGGKFASREVLRKPTAPVLWQWEREFLWEWQYIIIFKMTTRYWTKQYLLYLISIESFYFAEKKLNFIAKIMDFFFLLSFSKIPMYISFTISSITNTHIRILKRTGSRHLIYAARSLTPTNKSKYLRSI